MSKDSFENKYVSLVYTTQVNIAFGARWLASCEVISQLLFTSEHRAARETLKIDHFSVNCYRYSSFGAIYSTCVVYGKTIILLCVGE